MAQDLVALVKQKQAQIARLQAELDEVRGILESDDSAPKPLSPAPLRRRSRSSRKGLNSRPYKAKSSVGWTVKVLKEAGEPTHVDEIVSRIEKRGHKVKKTTLVGNIARYIKQGKVFYRAGPNVYGLIEWQRKEATDREKAQA